MLKNWFNIYICLKQLVTDMKNNIRSTVIVCGLFFKKSTDSVEKKNCRTKWA